MRALGIDYGRKRIGLALSDPTGLLARPWKTIARGRVDRQVAELSREIERSSAKPTGSRPSSSACRAGCPARPTSRPRWCSRWSIGLRGLIPVPIAVQDERLSSHEAEQLLARREKDWRKRKPLLDAAAAAVILQDYLDAQPRALPD